MRETIREGQRSSADASALVSFAEVAASPWNDASDALFQPTKVGRLSSTPFEIRAAAFLFWFDRERNSSGGLA